jgi:ferredoxin-NADP reductase
MTEMKSSVETWEGEEGYITGEMLKKYAPKEGEPIYYMAGPQGMVKAMNEMLIKNGVSKDDIKFEEFSGY